ncbi:MAG: hypothetical protein LBC76_08075 [Treponema sp.]|jgi:hypothetical protein|nr:hypothetical protein [Treponema sp.]
MTMKELLVFFENFYGEKYTGVFLDTMTAYLDGCTSEYYMAVRKVMVMRFPRIYNKVPGPAEIEKYMDEIDGVYAAMPKPLLPEPPAEYASPEEAAEWLKDIKNRLSKGTGPLAGAAIKAIGGV